MDVRNKINGKLSPGLDHMRRMHSVLLKFGEMNQHMEIRHPSASARIGPHIASIATILNSSIMDETARVNKRRPSVIFEETCRTLEPDPILEELRAGSVPEWSFSIIESKSAATAVETVSTFNAMTAASPLKNNFQSEQRPVPIFPPGLPWSQALMSAVESREGGMSLAMMAPGAERKRSFITGTALMRIGDNGNSVDAAVVKPVARPNRNVNGSFEAMLPGGKNEKCIIASTSGQTLEQKRVAIPFAKAPEPQNKPTGVFSRDVADSGAASALQQEETASEVEQPRRETKNLPSTSRSWAEVARTEVSPAKPNLVIVSPSTSSPPTIWEPLKDQLRIIFITNLPKHTTLHAIATTITEGAVYSIRFGADDETGARYCGIIFQLATAASEYLDKMTEMAARYAARRYVEKWLWPFATANYDAGEATTPVGIMLGEAFPATQELARMSYVAVGPVGTMSLPGMKLQFRTRRRITVVKSEIFRTWTFEGFRALCEKLVGGAANLQWVVVWNWGEASVCCADVVAAVKLKEELERSRRLKDAEVKYSLDPCEKVRGIRLPDDGTRGVLSWPAVWVNPN